MIRDKNRIIELLKSNKVVFNITKHGVKVDFSFTKKEMKEFIRLILGKTPKRALSRRSALKRSFEKLINTAIKGMVDEKNKQKESNGSDGLSKKTEALAI